MSADTSAHQRHALRLLARRRRRYPDEEWDGHTTSDSTWSDSTDVFVNWRTAEALQRRGLVDLTYIGPGEGSDVKLTEQGMRHTDEH